MSTQSPYLKAIIIFPLVTQLIGSIIAYVAFGIDYCKEGNFDAALFGFFLIINAYFAKYRGYLRHQWNKIFLFSFIILFCYWSISNLLIAQNTLYLTDRVLFVLEGSVILAIYTTIFLSLLLPKSK